MSVAIYLVLKAVYLFLPFLERYNCVPYFYFRSYFHPHPSRETVEDNVSRLIFSIVKSLSAGSVRSCTFSVPFSLNVFRYLFNGKGTPVPRRSSLSFDATDFNLDFFPETWYVVCDKHGNGCSIDIPIVMTSKLNYGPRCYIKNDNDSVLEKPRIFTGIVCVNLCKKRC